MHRTIDDVLETLKRAKDQNKKCTLLIGAGCSVKAGIPTAKGFVEVIAKEYAQAHKRAKDKTYPKCMAELSPGERRDLIARYVDTARINWAYLAIAQLMQNGYIDRVLTTNFDPLVVRACALIGQFPAVYDFAASQLYKSAYIPEQAVVYLHGQRTGFVLMNTDAEVQNHSKLMAPVFEDAGRGRVWLVVGYSGENDPVFDHLAKVPQFDYNLYWICYKDDAPAAHVRERLLQEGKYAFYVNGFDADDFFVTLAGRLNCFPPEFVRTPFSHLDSLFDMLTPYTIPGQQTETEVLGGARRIIRTAIDHLQDNTDGNKSNRRSSLILKIHFHFLAQDYDKVVELASKQGPDLPAELLDPISWAYVVQGNALADQAGTKSGEEADRLFVLAGEKYQAALVLKPDKHAALYDWGDALDDQARTKSGEEADRLFALAGEKYQAALALKPDMHEALNNWGSALAAQAGTKIGEEADRLFALAGEKYQTALAIKPDKHEALNNWGNALVAQAGTKIGEEADRLFALAGEKYQTALAIKPDMHEALNNWGNALAAQAGTKIGEEADRLFILAGEKYQASLAIKPDMHEALNNWGSALADQAHTKSGEEADRLFALAGEKYQAALVIKPEHEALYNWGLALAAQAGTKSGEEADRLFALAGEKYQAALVIKPDKHEALYNWGSLLMSQAKTKSAEQATSYFAAAQEKLLQVETLSPGSGAFDLACLHALQNKETECRRWLEICRQHGTLPAIEHIEKDSDLDSIRTQEWFIAFLKNL